MPRTLLDFTTQDLSASNPARLHAPGSVFARFLELRGRRIVKACGAMWYFGPGRFLMSLPYQALLNPDPCELKSMIREAGACGARFPSASWSGLAGGLYVMNAREYDIESVHAEERDQVLHSQERFNFRPATKAQMLSQGRALNLSAMHRHGRYDPEFGDPRQWETLVEAAFACSAISFPAVFAGPRLAAYMITCREHRWLHILHHMSPHEDRSDFPNHFLTYSVTKQAVDDESLEAVCYGYVPLSATGSLHNFKQCFGYELIPHRSAIQLHPVLDAVLNSRVARAAVSAVRSLCHEDQQLEIIEAVLEGAHSSRPGRAAGARPLRTI